MSDVRAKINKVEDSAGEVFVSMTVGFTPDDAQEWADFWEILGLLRDRVKPFLRSFTPEAFFPEIQQAVTDLTHPVVGRCKHLADCLIELKEETGYREREDIRLRLNSLINKINTRFRNPHFRYHSRAQVLYHILPRFPKS